MYCRCWRNDLDTAAHPLRRFPATVLQCFNNLLCICDEIPPLVWSLLVCLDSKEICYSATQFI